MEEELSCRLVLRPVAVPLGDAGPAVRVEDRSGLRGFTRSGHGREGSLRRSLAGARRRERKCFGGWRGCWV